MERDSRSNINTNNAGTSSTFTYGAGPSWMERLDQVTTAQHSSLGGASPLDLPSAIAREMQRSSTAAAGWQHTWRHPSAVQEQVPMGTFLWQDGNPNGRLSQFYIPRFEEALGSMHHHQQTGMQESFTESGSQGFFSRPSGVQGREDSGMRAAVCSPWIERMMQADVTTPTPCPSLGISTSLSLAQRAVGDVSGLASATTLDMQSDDLRQWRTGTQSIHCDSLQRRESTVELSADLCSDDEDLETHPIDDRRKKRMLSNRASAQRSRQRRQERLDQLEVLTAQLRVENSTLQKKLNNVVQVAKKLEDRNSNLLMKVHKLSKEVDRRTARKVMPAAAAPIAAAFDECEISQQTTCASACKMFGGWASMDPTLMRDGNNVNDGDGASSPSMSAGSPGRPNESDMDMETSKPEVSPLRESFSACRMGKKRSFGETEIADGASSFGGYDGDGASIGNEARLAPSQRSRVRPSLTGGGFAEASGPFASSFGLDPASEADRWLEFF